MIKNVAMFILSTFPETRKKNKFFYEDDDGVEKAIESVHTNETALKYFNIMLSTKKEKLDLCLAFCSEATRKKKTLGELKEELQEGDYFPEGLPEIIPENLENDGDLPGAFSSIASMYSYVQELAETEARNGNTIKIHIDITGGQRHASMLMLALMQLLSYSNIHLGMVVYSNLRKTSTNNDLTNKIEDASKLMSMYTLINGASNFVDYGDIAQIRKYFEPENNRNLSHELKQLIKSMEDLSDSIKICGDPESMKRVLSNLKRSITKYENFCSAEREKLNPQEVLFQKLLPRIKKEYAAILPDNINEIDEIKIIDWCLNKGFLQQAVTFYIEWMPAYIVKNGYITLRNSEFKQRITKESRNHVDWEMSLVRYYSKYSEDNLSKDNKMTTKIFRNALWRANNDLSTFKRLINNPVVDELSFEYDNFLKGKKASAMIPEIESNIDLFMVKELFLEDRIDLRSEVEANRALSLERLIFKAIEKMSDNDINLFFLLDDDENYQNKQNKPWQRGKIFLKMLSAEDIEISNNKMRLMRLITFIRLYNEYYVERCHLNHATSDTKTLKNNEITKKIRDSLKLLKL